MRHVMWPFCVTLLSVVLYGTPVKADEFGPRFMGREPVALSEYPAVASLQNIAQEQTIAEKLQDIAPAAGEESADENAPTNPLDTEPDFSE